MNLSVNLTKRVRVGAALRYCPVVFSANGRVKPDWVSIDGNPERHPEGAYYLDWTEEGSAGRKRKRVSVGSNASQALNKKLRKETELRAVSQGIAITRSKDDASDAGKHPLPVAVEDFLEEIRLSKQEKTHQGYRVALGYFEESCNKQFVEDVERMDLLRFAAFLKAEKDQSPRSVHNKFSCVLTFLSAYGKTGLAAKNDRPRFVRQEVEIYEHGELDKLFAVCSPYHSTLYKFLLMTGLREQEAMHMQWTDVNLNAGTVNMRYKKQYDFSPKAYREREVPIPTKLVDLLTAFRPDNCQGDELVFHTASGRPDIHMLRALKRNAVKAGLNPNRFRLHKFRSTFATMHLSSGIDLRTTQSFLGHTNLVSTTRYLKPARNETIRDRVNATFG